MAEPDAHPTGGVRAAKKRDVGGVLKIGSAVVGAVAVVAVALFLATWWLVQPGGLLHDAAGRFLARHATQTPR